MGAMVQLVQYGLWHVEPCHVCGTEFYVTRTMERAIPADKPLLCESCTSQQDGYDEGYRDGAVAGYRAAMAVAVGKKILRVKDGKNRV